MHLPPWRELSARANRSLAALPSKPGALRAAVAKDPTNPFLWLALAREMAALKGLVAEIAVLEQAVTSVPPGRRGGLFDRLGNAELSRGRNDAALAVWTRAVISDPHVPVFIALASAQMREGLLGPARSTFRKSLQTFPDAPVLWRAWASMEGRAGDVSVARRLWRTSIEKDPRNARAWYNLALSERKCEGTESAMKSVLREAVAACPMNCWLRVTLAKMEEKSDGSSAALRVLLPVERRNDEVVLRMMARLEFKHANIERARALYRRAADVEAVSGFRGKDKVTRTIRSLHAWALAESSAGHNDQARRLLEEAVSICHTDSGVYRAFGELEAKEKNFEQSRDAFQKAVALDPKDPRLLLAWGKMEVLAGNLETAESLMSRVAKDASLKEGEGKKGNEENNVESGSDSDFVSSNESVHVDDKASNKSKQRYSNAGITPHLLADALRERAMLASRNGQFENSLALLTRASQVEPNYPNGWRLLASQELRLHGVDSMRKVFSMALDMVDRGERPKVLHWWGQDEKLSGNMDDARDRFRMATCANPDYMSAWMSWGLLEKGEGNLERACRIFEQAAKRAETNNLRAPFIFQAWGRVEELRRGRPKVGAKIFQRGVNVAPTCGSLWTAWGLLEERRGNIEKARELFQRATTTDPKYGASWHSWALLEMHRCNFKRASELFSKGHEADSGNASLLSSWANMEGKELKNIEESRVLFERAVTADPYFGPAWQAWGCIEMNAGCLDKAKDLFLKAAEVQPKDAAPWHTLGVLEAEHRGDSKEAKKYWKKAIEIAPKVALGYQIWALYEGEKMGNMKEARRLFQVGIERVKSNSSDVAMLLQAWGVLEEKCKNTEEARRLLQRSLEADRRRAESWSCLAMIEKSRGNREVARQLVCDGVEAVMPSNKSSGLYVIWGNLEAEEGNIAKARELFAAGIRADPGQVGTWRAYAKMESSFGSESRAAEIQLTSDAMLLRKGSADIEFV